MPRTVLITGTSTGIGFATALAFAQQGFRVFATVRSDADAERVRAASANAIHTLLLDVRDDEAIEDAMKQVRATVGDKGLDVLVNNAGRVTSGPIELMQRATVRDVFAVNIEGVVSVTRVFLPLLRKAQGRIIQISSIGGRSTLPFAGVYCASKHALTAISDALRMELKPWGVDVVLIEPGSVATPIWTKGTRFQDVPGDAEQALLYANELRAAHHMVSDVAANGIAPQKVADLIVRAALVARPSTRYVIGPIARLRLFLQWLPARWRDWLILKKLNASK